MVVRKNDFTEVDDYFPINLQLYRVGQSVQIYAAPGILYRISLYAYQLMFGAALATYS